MNKSIINITPLNPNLSECHLKVLYHGLNRNGSYISKAVAEKLANKLPGTPIIGLYMEDKQDFDDHGERAVIENGKYTVKKFTKPFGYVKDNTEVWWESFEENGQVKDYMMCEGYLWTKTYPEVNRVLEKGNWQSMEFVPESLQGEWTQMNHENGKQKPMFMVEDAEFRGLCILGEDVEPCFETAAIGSPGSLFMLNDETDLESDFSQIKYSIEKSLEEGGSEVPQTENTNIVSVNHSEPESQGEATVVEPVVTEEPVVVEEPIVAEPVVEDAEGATPEQGEEPQEPVVQDSEEPVISEEPIEPVVEEPVQEEEPTEPEEDAKAQLEALSAKLAETVKELDEIKLQFSKANDELEVLRTLKAEVETNAKNAVFASFYMLDEEDVKSIREKQDTLTAEEIKKELALVAFEKKVNFSLLEDKDEEDDVITSFSAVVEDTTPAWLKRVEDFKKNRK